LQAVYDASDEGTRNLLAGSLSHILDREKRGIPAACECVAAYRGLFYITPEGSVFTCPNLLGTEHSIGNVKKVSLLGLCDRLSGLYSHLRGGGSNDQHVCTGERALYERSADKENLESLKTLQDALSKQLPTKLTNAQPLAYCVSRNF
jgi:MoaA/NifB/PqqE/SkfB family radical SAM enzyme